MRNTKPKDSSEETEPNDPKEILRGPDKDMLTLLRTFLFCLFVHSHVSTHSCLGQSPCESRAGDAQHARNAGPSQRSLLKI